MHTTLFHITHPHWTLAPNPNPDVSPRVCAISSLNAEKKKHKDGNRTSYWKFVLQENGLNFIDHEPGCKSTAKLTGN